MQTWVTIKALPHKHLSPAWKLQERLTPGRKWNRKKLLTVLAGVSAVVGGLLYIGYERSEDYSCLTTAESLDDRPNPFDSSARYALRLYPFRKWAYANFPVIWPRNPPEVGFPTWVDEAPELEITDSEPLEYIFQKHFNFTKRTDGIEDVVGRFDRINKTIEFFHVWTDGKGQSHDYQLAAQCRPA